MASLEELLATWDGLVEIQTSPGNWDVDEYMRGMANGMILAKHHFSETTGAPPPYLEAPG